jgi:uncharacterized membrane protein YhaH (DUF805 family)
LTFVGKWIYYIKRLIDVGRPAAHDLIILLAFGAVLYGVYLVFVPAAWILGGGAVLWLSLPNRKK